MYSKVKVVVCVLWQNSIITCIFSITWNESARHLYHSKILAPLQHVSHNVKVFVMEDRSWKSVTNIGQHILLIVVSSKTWNYKSSCTGHMAMYWSVSTQTPGRTDGILQQQGKMHLHIIEQTDSEIIQFCNLQTALV